MTISNAIEPRPPKTDNPYYMGNAGDVAYLGTKKSLQDTLHETMKLSGDKLFMVETHGLFEVYLDCFEDPVERQLHNCNCCHHFISRFGGLVRLTEHGEQISALWDEHRLPSDTPAPYRRVVQRMAEHVATRQVTVQFLWKDLVWGTPEAGGFSHFHVKVFKGSASPALTAGQDMAIRREDRKHLAIALNDMKVEVVQKAVSMLEAGGLNNKEALLPMGRFLLDVHHSVRNAHGPKKDRILWYHVGRAARGWCTPRGSAFGALVYDIAEGKSAAEVTRAHNERMDPIKYQRPQAAPSAGNVSQAEKLVKELGLSEALRRKPMALEEAQLFWKPREKERDATGGIFDHLKPKVTSTTDLLTSSPVVMTWVKFQRDILPSMLSMRFRIPYQGNFGALSTATDPTAPPIMKWDRLDRRNPASWHHYHPYSTAAAWGLVAMQWVNVLGLCKMPPEWNGEESFQYMTHGIIMAVLEGARDLKPRGLGIFPNNLLNELHGVRATIEAFSNAGTPDPEPRQLAAGYLIGGEHSSSRVFEVTTSGGRALYDIDRLE
jgi:hypothetical protein